MVKIEQASMTREELISKVETLFHMLNRKIKNDINELLKGELTFSDFVFLKYLKRNGLTKSSDIAHSFHVSLPNITTIADRLEKKNLISRERAKADRRVVELNITDEGTKTLERILLINKSYFESISYNVTDIELSQLINILEKVTVNQANQ